METLKNMRELEAWADVSASTKLNRGGISHNQR